MKLISLEIARELVCQYLSRQEQEIGEALQLIDSETIEQSFGWIFFYNSKHYLETGDFSNMLVGNAPLIVDKCYGNVYITGTALPIDSYIADFEKQYQKTLSSQPSSGKL